MEGKVGQHSEEKSQTEKNETVPPHSQLDTEHTDRITSLSRRTINSNSIKLILNTSLETILEDTQIKEGIEDIWNISLVDEKASHDHKGNNESWSQGSCYFYLRNDDRHQESPGNSVPVGEDLNEV